MFGNNKKSKYWDESRAFLIKQLGLEEDATDAEISAALKDAEEDVEEETEVKPKAEDKPAEVKAEEKAAEKPAETKATTEGSVSKAEFDTLQAKFEKLSSDVEALKKVPALSLTDGKKDTPVAKSTPKKAYLESDINKRAYKGSGEDKIDGE